MKSIILAAGLGKRLKPFTDTNPKCLVEINNKSLLENILNHLSDVGVSEAWIVTGYLSNNVKERIGDTYKNITIKSVFVNSLFDSFKQKADRSEAVIAGNHC